MLRAGRRCEKPLPDSYIRIRDAARAADFDAEEAII